MRFCGEFVRTGRKRTRGWGPTGDGTVPTILLRNVRRHDTGLVVTDHLWFNLTQGFEDADVKTCCAGEVIAFDARIDDYIKGYERDSYDYKLSRPTKIKIHGFPEWEDWDGPAFYSASNCPCPQAEL